MAKPFPFFYILYMHYTLVIIGVFNSYGEKLISLLEHNCLKKNKIILLETKEHAGLLIHFDGGYLNVKAIDNFQFKEASIVFICNSLLFDKKIKNNLSFDSYIIDCSGLIQNAPYLIPSINLTGGLKNKIISSPTTVALVLSIIFNTLHQLYPSYFACCVLLSASEFGQYMFDQLWNQTRSIYAKKFTPLSPYEKQLAFNLIPEINPTYITKTKQQISSICKVKGIITSAFIPVFIGNCIQIEIRFKNNIPKEQVIELLNSNKKIHFLSEEENPATPIDVLNSDAIFISHLKKENNKTVLFWIVFNNSLMNSINNALEIANFLENSIS